MPSTESSTVVSSSVTELKKQIEHQFGGKIVRARECGLLSDEIQQVTGQQVSEATLRRFFGLMATHSKPSRFTLETLALYTRQKKKKQQLTILTNNSVDDLEKLRISLFNEANGDARTVIHRLLDLDITALTFYNLASYLLIKAVEANDASLILAFYTLKSYIIDDKRPTCALGNALQNNQRFAHTFIPQLAKVKSARLYFFERYVNTGVFRTYKAWLKAYQREETDPLKKIWVEALLGWGNYLSGKAINTAKFMAAIENQEEVLAEAHPFIKARVFGLGVHISAIHEDSLARIEAEINREYIEVSKYRTYVPYFSVMIMHYLLPFACSRLYRKIIQIFQVYVPSRKEDLDYSIGFLVRLLKSRISGKPGYTLAEVEQFRSGLSGEDYMVQWIGLHLLNAPDNPRVQQIKKSIIDQSGFTLLEEFPLS